MALNHSATRLLDVSLLFLLLATLLLATLGCASLGTTSATQESPPTEALATDSVAEGEPSRQASRAFAEATEGSEHWPGFFDLYWDERKGKVLLATDLFDEEFLYVSGLSAGVGSNDIGLDRGQLGGSRLVDLRRVGNRVLLVERNTRYRANSDSAAERRAVREAFAESVLFGFEVVGEKDGKVLFDVTPFLLRDAHGVAATLDATGEGKYSLDASRSAPYLEYTGSFAKNTELEATLTFTGSGEGRWLRSVAPDPTSVTVRQHHSFVELPDDGYQPRVWDPRSGYISQSFFDYATPISQPIEQRYVIRHRLEKKDPGAAVSEPVEPIVYWLDPGTPEPIRSALLDGARWWNQAFEAAGFENGFIVKMLPEDANPLDLQYNLIQWVHRSTRGWSYGGAVVDPRTGEILKGKVTLGSLRVRQDYLIAEALLAPYEDGETVPSAIEELALARLRQLSAHEVGHTIGLVHNYTSSVDGRASVMDYPHPLFEIDDNGEISAAAAYDTGIGEWDAYAVRYGYEVFPPGTDEQAALEQLLAETRENGWSFLSDQDARPLGGAHPRAHLWDNGTDAAEELERMMAVRELALSRFGERNIRNGVPLSNLDAVLTPLYLFHRYQVEAATKMVGGLDYTYAVRGDGQVPTAALEPAVQRRALDSVLATIAPDRLALPESVLASIPPPAAGLGRGREHLPTRTGVTFDPLAAAEVAAEMTVGLLLHPERASRLVVQNARDENQPDLTEVIDALLLVTWDGNHGDGLEGAVGRVVDAVALRHLMNLAVSDRASAEARAIAYDELTALAERLKSERPSAEEGAHRSAAAWTLERFFNDPLAFELPPPPIAPDGSPIGSGESCGVWESP